MGMVVTMATVLRILLLTRMPMSIGVTRRVPTRTREVVGVAVSAVVRVAAVVAVVEVEVAVTAATTVVAVTAVTAAVAAAVHLRVGLDPRLRPSLTMQMH